MSITGQGNLEGHQPWDLDEWRQWRQDAQRELREHGDALEQILELLEDEGVGGPLHWETMSPPHRAKVMSRLRDFVAFLDRTYFQFHADYSIKACWWQHPDVVWQLTALWAAFGVAYSPKARPSDAQATWHERFLWPILDRLRVSSMRPCSGGRHEPSLQDPLRWEPGLQQQIEEWSEGNDTALGYFGGHRGGIAGTMRSTMPVSDGVRIEATDERVDVDLAGNNTASDTDVLIGDPGASGADG